MVQNESNLFFFKSSSVNSIIIQIIKLLFNWFDHHLIHQNFKCFEWLGVGEEQTFDCALDIIKLKEMASKGGYYSYVAGTAAVILEEKHYNHTITQQQHNIKTTHTRTHTTYNDDVIHGSDFKGVYIKNHCNTLPMGKGLSSSAAVCVLVAKCFNHVSRAVIFIDWLIV